MVFIPPLNPPPQKKKKKKPFPPSLSDYWWHSHAYVSCIKVPEVKRIENNITIPMKLTNNNNLRYRGTSFIWKKRLILHIFLHIVRAISSNVGTNRHRFRCGNRKIVLDNEMKSVV